MVWIIIVGALGGMAPTLLKLAIRPNATEHHYIQSQQFPITWNGALRPARRDSRGRLGRKKRLVRGICGSGFKEPMQLAAGRVEGTLLIV